VSLFFRRRRETRSDFVMPRPMTVYGSAGSFADVDLSSMESSLQSVAVRSTVDLIASLASELPVDVFTGKGDSRRQIPIPGYLEDPAGEGYGLSDWIYQGLESWLLRGNLFGKVLDRGPGNFPRQVDLLHPDHVQGRMDGGVVEWSLGGRTIPADQLWHRRVNPVPGVVLGLSPVQSHAADLGLNITLTRFGLQYFREGAHPGAILRNTEKEIKDEAVARAVKDRFLAAVRGSREPAVMGKGWEYEAIKISPEESQFLETRGFSAAECARIFGPGFAQLLGYQQAGTSMTYANVVDHDLHILKYGLGKWLRRTDRLLTEMLPRPQYARLNRDALLETSTMERYKAHESALKNRWKVVNEVRRNEDMEPVEWGNEPNNGAAGGQQPSQGAEGDSE
jgi:HK97 family phage portal protein